MSNPYPQMDNMNQQNVNSNDSRQQQGLQSPQRNQQTDDQQGILQLVTQDRQLNLDQYYQQQQINQNKLTMSVGNIKGFYEEQLASIGLDPQKSDHPVLALFTFVLKGAPFFIYFFLGWFTSRNWTIPEVMIVVSSIDFWVTKNVAGRRLVGLRWWEEIDEATNKQNWVFESRLDTQSNKSVNEGIFWTTQVAAFLGWGFLAILNVLTLSVLNLVGIGFCLITNAANLYFFIQCSRVQKNRAKQLAQVLGVEIIKKMASTSVVWPMKNPHRKAQ